jgi:hypothetical protein
MVQDWSTSSTYAWTPSSSDAGAWSIEVQVRSAGTSAPESSGYGDMTITTGDPAVVTALTPNKPSPQSQGSTIIWTSQATGGTAPLEFRYFRTRSNTAPVMMVQDWSTSSSYTWTPASTDSGDWWIEVQVRSAGSTAAESSGYGDMTITAGDPAMLTGLTADKPSPQVHGSAITWTPQVSGGTGPLEYRYYRSETYVTDYELVQDWSTASTYTWTPTPADTGGWTIQVQVRSAGGSEFESVRFADMRITVADPATLTGLTADKPSPQVHGSAITWTPQVSGGTGPLEYRYYRSETYVTAYELVQDWSTASTYTWTPTAVDTGDWTIQVQVRSAGGSEFESVRFADMRVTGADPAVLTGLTADKPSPLAQGSPITWTPQVSGGTAPLEYRYYRAQTYVTPYELVQDWSTVSTYTWTPTSADTGDWTIQVQVRSAGASATESNQFSSIRITIGDPAIVSGLTADNASPQTQGSPITWTPQVNGGIAPLEYRFYRAKTYITDYVLVQDWSTNSTYRWTPTASDTGDWTIQVQVRSAGASSFESNWFASMTITAGN